VHACGGRIIPAEVGARRLGLGARTRCSDVPDAEVEWVRMTRV
jgi:hypothetical protein